MNQLLFENSRYNYKSTAKGEKYFQLRNFNITATHFSLRTFAIHHLEKFVWAHEPRGAGTKSQISVDLLAVLGSPKRFAVFLGRGTS